MYREVVMALLKLAETYIRRTADVHYDTFGDKYEDDIAWMRLAGQQLFLMVNQMHPDVTFIQLKLDDVINRLKKNMAMQCHYIVLENEINTHFMRAHQFRFDLEVQAAIDFNELNYHKNDLPDLLKYKYTEEV